MNDLHPQDYPDVDNARVRSVVVGSAYHDGRGFFTVLFDGNSWGQGRNLEWNADTIA